MPRFHLALPALAALLAIALPALAEDDIVRVQGVVSPIKGHVEGFRGAKAEVRTALGVVRVETRFLQSIEFGAANEPLFEDDFPGTELNKVWQVDSGDWKVENGSVVGHSDRDNAFLKLRETLKGDAVLDVDAEITTTNARGGLHVGIGGQNWVLYPEWGGIYPPYQEKTPEQYGKGKDGEFVLKSHFRFVRRGTRYEFWVGEKLYMAATGAPSNLVDDHIILAAAHNATVRYRKLRLSTPLPEPDAAPGDFKAPGDVIFRTAAGKRLPGSLAKMKDDTLASSVPAEGGDVALTGLAWIAFPPSAPADLALELDEAAKAKIEAMIGDLGNADAAARDKATAALTAAGPLAIPALTTAVKSADKEVAARAKSILEVIQVGPR
ncbi:MAG: hypothetical protein K8T20_15575 [Planctomycetes bacterium]|nr:hypothetical protein [Planctomycetota bacterium]